MSGRCLIISGGDFDQTFYTQNTHEFDYVIACDKGYEYAVRYGITPDLVVGDFDSVSIEVDPKISVIRLPAAKDDTDTGYAARWALEKGYDSITIICAMGGRFDHQWANIQTLASIASQGAWAAMLSEDTIVHALCASSIILPARSNWSFSVFAFSDTCEGVTIEGAAYNTADTILNNTYPIGESNEWSQDSAYVSCTSGILLVIESRLPV